MAVKVLVVDDSSFFRRRVSEILEQDSDIQVIGFAVNGREAVEKAAQLRPDMITMDVEMPVLDGISAVKEIMASNPTPILMFSSLTRDGATATFDALDAGAMDFLPKKFEDIARNNEDAIKLLQSKVKDIGRRRYREHLERQHQLNQPFQLNQQVHFRKEQAHQQLKSSSLIEAFKELRLLHRQVQMLPQCEQVENNINF